jgi:hypothetical protein
MDFTVVNAMYFEYDVNESKEEIIGSAMDVGNVQELAKTIVNLTANEKAINSMRKYGLQRDTAEVYTLINNIYDNPDLFEKNSFYMTYVLYDSELKRTHVNKEKFNPKEGNLLILNIETVEEKFFIFAKLISKDYFDKQSKTLKPGLDIENMQKVAIFNYTLENELSLVYVRDYTTPTYATYWWNEFLQLEEMNSDQKNTSTLYNRVHTKISRSLRNTAQDDYYNLKGSVLTYLRSHQTFNFNEFYNDIFKDYIPENSEAADKIDKLKKDIASLSEKGYFDNHFNIDSSAIKARQPKKYSLRNGITLSIKDYDIPFYKEFIKKYYKNNTNYAIIELDENNIDNFNEFDKIDDINNL